jgi:hypothetical protein
MMRATRYPSWVFVFSALWMAVSLGLAVDQAAGQSPRAKIITVEGATTTYQVEGMHGQMVTVDVPSSTRADIKLSDPAQGTVLGKVVALDGETNRVKVHTQAGQTIVLEVPHDTVMRTRLGDTFTLAVSQPAGR